MWPAVKKQLNINEFEEYIDTLQLRSWIPKGITLHHTWNPTVKMRPTGFSIQHLKNLESMYRDDLGWSGGPHLFIDQFRISIFNDLRYIGVHAKGFNQTHWSIEMLGNYDKEELNPAIFNNTFHALALMCKKLGKDEKCINFHRDSEYTDKSCPGNKVKKDWVHENVKRILEGTEHKVTVYLNDIMTPWSAYFDSDISRVFIKVSDIKTIANFESTEEYVAAFSVLKEPNFKLVWNSETKSLKVYKLQ